MSLNCFLHYYAPDIQYQHDIEKCAVLLFLLHAPHYTWGTDQHCSTTTNVGLTHAHPLIRIIRAWQYIENGCGLCTMLLSMLSNNH